jgi:hypothetical protein
MLAQFFGELAFFRQGKRRLDRNAGSAAENFARQTYATRVAREPAMEEIAATLPEFDAAAALAQAPRFEIRLKSNTFEEQY